MNYFVILGWVVFALLDFGEAQNYSKCESAIECECEDLGEITGVMCRNISDFGRWSEKLRGGDMFPVNETYEITLTNVTDLPAEALNGLIVYRLYIEGGTTASVSPVVFKNVIRLKRLHVRSSLLKVIPKLSFVNNSLRKFNFDGSKLTKISDELNNLPLLTELTLRNNSIDTIDAEAFSGTDAIEILDLSNNLLVSLPPNLLDSLHSLRKLSLSFNHLTTMYGLLRIARPRIVLLGRNNLTNADEIFYKNMTLLETIDLNHNPLKRLSNDSFNLKLPNVRFLHLDYCEIEEFDVDHYINLTILAILELSGNSITTISNRTIDFGKNMHLILNDNKISSFIGEISFSVKRLFLNGNRMRLLGKTLQLTQLAIVEISDNFLEAVLESDLRGMHSTQNLVFRNNSISLIDRSVFYIIRNDLKTLDLSYNRIKSLNGSMRYLSTLKSLNVSHNFLRTFEEKEFVGLNELSELYMQNNRIIALGGQLQTLPQLRFLIIQHNQISTLAVEMIPRSLNFLYVEDNPLQCDCRLMPFLELVDSPTATLETDVFYCLAAETTEKSRLYQECIYSCSCYCTRDVNDTFVAVDCRARNISFGPILIGSEISRVVAPLSTLSTTSLYMEQNKASKFLVVDRVLSIDLENNYIESLATWNPPADLKEIRLAENLLTTLPASVSNLEHVRKLTLSKNPWHCDCASLTMKRWMITRSEGILDFNETRCGLSPENRQTTGRLISSLSDVDLCPSYVGLYISLTFGLLILLLAAASGMILYHRYEIIIKVWLYSRGVSWVKQDELDQDKTFEAFISYSNEDKVFVFANLVQELQKRVPGVKLCLHDIHFPPGEFIHTNIINAVKFSKRTILVLSKHFLKSDWCLLEFNTAHKQGMEDKMTRIVVIILGDLPKDIHPDIRSYLKSTTYVQWGDKYFWQKLVYAIPKPSKPRHLDAPMVEYIKA